MHTIKGFGSLIELIGSLAAGQIKRDLPFQANILSFSFQSFFLAFHHVGGSNLVSVYFQHDQQFITLLGKTYVHRQTIKAMGGFFEGGGKVWKVPFSEKNLEIVSLFCRNLGGGPMGAQPQEEAIAPSLDLAPAAAPSTETAATAATDSLTVGELVHRAALHIQNSFPDFLWIVGEVQNVSIKKTGAFFSLAEQDGSGQQTISVSAFIWQHQLNRIIKKHSKEVLDSILQDGFKIRVLCQVQLYKSRAQISLVISDLDPAFTKGQLALQREELIKELHAKGLFDKNRQTYLPALPFRVALITAKGSRAYGDFTHQLEEGGFCGQVLFFPASMQGAETAAEVCHAIQLAIQANADVIVLTRGGGSAADLIWFDAKEIAYGITQCPIPIIAAIGHHEDRSVAEDVAYIRRKTPTAAADFILEAFARVSQQLIDSQKLLGHLAVETIIREKNKLEKIQVFWQQACLRMIEAIQSRLMALLAALDKGFLQQISLREQTVNDLEKALISKDPRPWLKKGWTQITRNKKPVLSISDIKIGDEIAIPMADGHIRASVLASTRKEEGSKSKNQQGGS